MAKTIATAPTTITATIAATRARPTILRSSRCGASCGRTSSPACCWPRALPLILAGDEVGNSQNGNNNAYCQDNEIGWIGWENLGKERRGFQRVHRPHDRAAPAVSARSAAQPLARWHGARTAAFGVLWLTPSAEEMKEQDWNFPEGRFLAYVLGPAEPRRRADLYRAERRTGADRVQAAEDGPSTRAGSRC